MNSFKIINLADSSDPFDAVNDRSLLKHQWLYASLGTAVTSGFTATQTLLYDAFIAPPESSPDLVRNIHYDDTNGEITVEPGTYKITL